MVDKALIPSCKARYAVLFQIWTFPSKLEDEAHIGPTATYDKVIYPGFQHDITHYRYKVQYLIQSAYNYLKYNTSAEDIRLGIGYKQMPSGKGKTHHAHTTARVQALRQGPLASRRRVFAKASRRRIVELH